MHRSSPSKTGLLSFSFAWAISALVTVLAYSSFTAAPFSQRLSVRQALSPGHIAVRSNSAGYALRFRGTGANDIDRVKIPVDNPETPADVGASDFTIEWWMRLPADSSNTPGSCVEWICGNILFDRDILSGNARDYGISLFNGRIRFGSGSTSTTVQSSARITDTTWHHVAVTRARATGAQCIFIDGVLDICGNTPAGDISYPNGYTDVQAPNNPYLVDRKSVV